MTTSPFNAMTSSHTALQRGRVCFLGSWRHPQTNAPPLATASCATSRLVGAAQIPANERAAQQIWILGWNAVAWALVGEVGPHCLQRLNELRVVFAVFKGRNWIKRARITEWGKKRYGFRVMLCMQCHSVHAWRLHPANTVDYGDAQYKWP